MKMLDDATEKRLLGASLAKAPTPSGPSNVMNGPVYFPMRTAPVYAPCNVNGTKLPFAGQTYPCVW